MLAWAVVQAVSLPQESRRGRNRGRAASPASQRPYFTTASAHAAAQCQRRHAVANRPIRASNFSSMRREPPLQAWSNTLLPRFDERIFSVFSGPSPAQLKANRLYTSAAASVHASTLQKEATRSPSVPQRGWLQNLGEQRSLWAVQRAGAAAAQKRSRDARRRAVAPTSSLRGATSGGCGTLARERGRAARQSETRRRHPLDRARRPRPHHTQ